MACGITDPLGCVGDIVGAAAGSAWDGICESFAVAADDLLKAFARAFTAIPPVDLASPGVRKVYAICLGIAALIAVLLLLFQVMRTAFTHDGSALAEGLTGIAKAAAAFILTLTVASAAITAADALTAYIIDQSFGSAAGLTAKVTSLISFAGPAGAGPAGELAGAASLLLLLAVIGILLIVVLWFELLLRNAALVVLVATSPIAAAGQVSGATRAWWPKLASATVQLIIVKPVIALVFALGFELTGQSRDIETLLTGMLILLLAVVAWPAVAMFLPFTSVGAGSAGLGMLLGFAAGRLTAAGGPPAGIPPSEFSRTAEAASTAGTATAGAVTGGTLALAAAGARAAQRAVTFLSGRMDQVAGHAGLTGAGSGQTSRTAGPARPSRAGPDGPSIAASAQRATDAPATAGDWLAGYPDAAGQRPAGSQPPPEWPEHYPGDWSEPAAAATAPLPADLPSRGEQDTLPADPGPAHQPSAPEPPAASQPPRSLTMPRRRPPDPGSDGTAEGPDQ